MKREIAICVDEAECIDHGETVEGIVDSFIQCKSASLIEVNGIPLQLEKSSPVSFAMGDKVRLRGKKGDEVIISEAMMDASGNMEYATRDYAWIDHEDLQLVHRATHETLKQVYEGLDDWVPAR